MRAVPSRHAHDRLAAGSRRGPQRRTAGARRPRRGPGGLGATCVGSLSRVRLRLASGAEHRTWQGPFEIVALTGTLSPDGGHLHLAVADHQGRTVGGHLAEGCVVRTTAEVVLGADDRLVFAREHDPATGYDELVVRERDP
jgi:predicted DNA-binding protein with PD1-like motif